MTTVSSQKTYNTNFQYYKLDPVVKPRGDNGKITLRNNTFYTM
ncbi:MAG TPA: palindromic element RPE4 domain-containing protein [Rickettsia endosymbiont of Omalisus fontisbellaquei]|nr:palindromic element RPE4 domain-containing protein [Rickettsia endosymbiont of Omalisus fontisbellaquei]